MLHVYGRQEGRKHSIHERESEHWRNWLRLRKRVTWGVSQGLIDAHLVDKRVVTVTPCFSVEEHPDGCPHLAICAFILVHDLQLNIVLLPINGVL